MAFFVLAENAVQLVPDGSLFLHIALVLLMIWILNATLFKPINRILEDRERRTGGRSGEARAILKDVDEKLARYEKALRNARAEGYALMERERTEALSERQATLNKNRDEMRGSLEAEKRAIESQKEAARASLHRDARDMAIEISERILRRPVKDATASDGSSQT